MSDASPGKGDIVMYMMGEGAFNDVPAIIVGIRWVDGEQVADLNVFTANHGAIAQLGVKRYKLPPRPAIQWRDPRFHNQWFVKGDF